jgi:hypothetical protein
MVALAPTWQGRYRLAPDSDVLPTSSGQGDQEFVVESALRGSILVNAMSPCELFGHTPAQATAEPLQSQGRLSNRADRATRERTPRRRNPFTR